MSLPKLNVTIHETVLPSTDTVIKFRPFLVKEEKLLLTAMEDPSQSSMLNAVKAIIDSCVQEKLDVEKLPIFDIEYLFLQLRAKSVGEIASLQIPFPDDEEVKCKVEVDLTKVKVEVHPEHTNEIDIADDIKVVMLYPQFDLMALTLSSDESPIDQAFKLIARCMGQLYFGEDMYEASDQTEEELTEFLENLTQDQFTKLQTFFDTMPKVKHEVDLVHPKTKKKAKYTLEGLNSFF